MCEICPLAQALLPGRLFPTDGVADAANLDQEHDNRDSHPGNTLPEEVGAALGRGGQGRSQQRVRFRGGGALSCLSIG